VDNLDKVDYLSLDVLTTKPYPRTIVGSNPLTTWLVEVQSNSAEIALWRIAVIDPANGGDGYARVYRIGPSGVEAQESSNLVIHTASQGSTDWTSDDGTLKLVMWGTGFSVADAWTFKTYPYNLDHELEDFTVPIYDEGELSITVNPQQGVE